MISSADCSPTQEPQQRSIISCVLSLNAILMIFSFYMFDDLLAKIRFSIHTTKFSCIIFAKTVIFLILLLYFCTCISNTL